MSAEGKPSSTQLAFTATKPLSVSEVKDLLHRVVRDEDWEEYPYCIPSAIKPTVPPTLNRVILAWRNGMCVGYVVWRMEEDGQVIMDLFCVALRGENIGQALFAEFADNVAWVTLGQRDLPVTWQTSPAAKPFYKALGFEVSSSPEDTYVVTTTTQLAAVLRRLRTVKVNTPKHPSRVSVTTNFPAENLAEFVGGAFPCSRASKFLSRATDFGRTLGWLIVVWDADAAPAAFAYVIPVVHEADGRRARQLHILVACAVSEEAHAALRGAVFRFALDKEVRMEVDFPVEVICEGDGSRMTTDEIRRMLLEAPRGQWAVLLEKSKATEPKTMPAVVSNRPGLYGYFIVGSLKEPSDAHIRDAQRLSASLPAGFFLVAGRTLADGTVGVLVYKNGRNTHMDIFDPETSMMQSRHGPKPIEQFYRHHAPLSFRRAQLEMDRYHEVLKSKDVARRLSCLDWS